MKEEIIINYTNGKPSPLKILAMEHEHDASIAVVSLVGVGDHDNSDNCSRTLEGFFKYKKVVLDLSEYQEEHYFLAFQSYLKRYYPKVRIVVLFDSPSCPFFKPFLHLRDEIWHVADKVSVASSVEEAAAMFSV